MDLLVCRSGFGGLVWICWSADQVVEAYSGPAVPHIGRYVWVCRSCLHIVCRSASQVLVDQVYLCLPAIQCVQVFSVGCHSNLSTPSRICLLSHLCNYVVQV